MNSKDTDKHKYLFFDMGHDSIKCGSFSKNINKPYDYFMIPTQLYPKMKDELDHSNLHKNHIEIETLKILNDPNRMG